MRASISFSHLSRRTAVLILLLFLATVTYAQITPLGDSYTNTATPTTNYGAKVLLDVQSASQTTYIQFDLSSIPAGYTSANLAKATLKLYVNAVTTAGSFNVDYVNGSWAENTITASNAPALGTTIAASVPLVKANVHDYILIDVTPAVGAWLDGTETNDGIALVGNSPLNASFDSKESTTQSHPPELDIVFTGGGGGGTITGVLTGSGSGLTGGGTSGTLNLSLINTCAANQVLQWTGSAWACSSAGTGTITGVTAGTDLTGGGTSGNVTLNLDLTKVPQLSTPNTFTGNQTVSGNLSATGLVTGTAFNIGSNLFAFGSYANYNAFLGFAGNSTSTGLYNTGSGVMALLWNTTGQWNTAHGAGALLSNTTGNYDTAAGSWALTANTTGNSNTATGSGTLNANTTGNSNTATGSWALGTNTTGNYNTASGQSALGANTTGASNTASGYQALYNNTTGSSNTALGSNAGPDQNSPNLNNATAIGANAVVSASNALVLGCVNGVNNCPAAVNVGIGTAKPAYMLDVQGTGNFTGLVNFASGQKFPGTGTITGITTAAGSGLTGGGTSGTLNLSLLTSCASGQVLAWSGSAWACTTLGGGGTVTSVSLTAPSTDFIVTGSPVTTSGTLGLGWLVAPDPNDTANAIVKRDSSGNFSAGTINAVSAFNLGGGAFAFGTYSLQNAFLGFAGNTTMSGGLNTGSGWEVLYANTTGSYNTADGARALSNNTTGGGNTASGANALQANTTGTGNTASGVNALQANTTGGSNTATGSDALFANTTASDNTASGYEALFSNTTGGDNTASGYEALLSNTTGNYNTATGYQALYSNVGDSAGDGWENTAVGYQALYNNNDTSGTGALARGNTAVGVNALYTNTTGLGNTGSGQDALHFNTTGADNTASGYLALLSNTFGNYNTASGTHALYYNTTGSNNTALGYNAGPDGASTNLTNATAIGANAVVSESNALVLGGTGSNAVSVGIGTARPAYTLDVQGSGRFTGNLTKGGGSFKIDHPLDPANKYLSHSFVESPDMMNIYNGNVVTDKRGLATIELPDWFEALNRDFRYQLTVIGQFAQAIVMQKIHNNRFLIKTSKPGVEVSWQVTGIRQDAYANAYRIPVEEVKPPQEQGRYLHPELFGAGPEKSVNARTAKPSAETPAQTAALSPAGRATQQH